MFKISTVSADGTPDHLIYDPHTSSLTDSRGTPLRDRLRDEASALGVVERVWGEPLPILTPDHPATKSNAPTRLKIQLGLGCNYSCSYCLQGQELATQTRTSTRDAEIFLAQLDRWLDPSRLTKIEFWGGEPLLYWHKLEVLVPALRARFPDATFLTISNGSLLTPEYADKLHAWGFNLVLSHDGPGQHVRGPDPLEDPAVLANWQYAIDLFQDRMSVNAVLTPVSYDPLAIIDWLRARLDRPRMNVNFEGVVHEYNPDDPNSRFTPAQLDHLTQLIVEGFNSGRLMQVSGFRNRVRGFMESILQARPAHVLSQKCGMDRPDQLAVDLLGNVSTCQNTGTKGRHRLGHVMAMDKVRLNTSWRWSARPQCVACPVLQLCQGACMYQEGEQFDASCAAELAFNTAMLVVAVQVMTQSAVTAIEPA